MQIQTDIGNGQGVSLQQLINDLKVVVNDGESLLKNGAANLRDKAKAGAKATDESIRRNPYPSMGIVFGLGLVLGVLAFNISRGGRRRQIVEEYR